MTTVKQDIGRFDVAMDHTFMMRIINRVTDRGEEMKDFVGRWNNPEDIKSDFDSLTSETNELMVELGNEGYFDALGVEDVPVDLNLTEEIDDEFDDEFEE